MSTRSPIVPQRQWNAKALLALQRAFLSEEIPGEVLRTRPDSKVVRLRLDDNSSVILKQWVRPGLRGTLRRLTLTSSVRREWRTLCRLKRFGVRVPDPLARSVVPQEGRPFTDAILMEDLGNCEMALEYAKDLLQKRDASGLRRFEDAVIEITSRMFKAGVVDTDHGLVNIVVTPNGEPVRLDFEVAQLVHQIRLRPHAAGLMLGRLLETYVYVVQPNDMASAERFALRVADAIRATPAMLRAARTRVDAALQLQKRRCGLDVRLELPW